MKMTTDQNQKTSAGLALQEEYRRALERYISESDEAALGSAYELGRKALAASTSLLELASAHHEILGELMANSRDAESQSRVLRAAAAFLSESLSAYEMAQRGFQEAVTALRQMNERLEEQIKGIAYAVHDDAGQLLVAVHLALASLAIALPKHQQEQIVRIEGLLNDVEAQLRRYSHELRPTILDDLGWVPAIRFLADSVSKRSKLSVRVNANFTGRLPAPAEIAIYRVVQEALNNAVKHANATSVAILTSEGHGSLHCSIRDDGVGFDVQGLRRAGARRGLGLSGMQERMNAIGGTVHIESAPGRGTELLINFPLEKAYANSSRARG